MQANIEKSYYVYITASSPRGVLYTGMTGDLVGRVDEHRERVMNGFSKRYWVGRLVWYEQHTTPEAAMRREKAIKRWRRDWKIELIETSNPTWRDLFADVVREQGFEA